MANAQTVKMWLRMRPISAYSTRMYWPRSGAWTPSSFSTASAKACSWFCGDDVVEPVEVRDRLQVGLVLDQLLGAAMEQADVRVGALDGLAVHLQHQTQNAVRRRMLRPEVQREVLDLGLGHQLLLALLRLLVARQQLLHALPRG